MNQVEPLNIVESNMNSDKQASPTKKISHGLFNKNFVNHSGQHHFKFKKINSKQAIRVIKVILARSILIGSLAWILSFTLCSSKGQNIFYLILLPILIVVIETSYICIARKGEDFKWISISALAYSFVMVIVIWIGSSYKYTVKNLECKNETINHLEKEFFKMCLSVEWDSCEILQIITCAFVIPLILHRWISPHCEKIHKTRHSALVVILLSSAADIVDFVEYSSFETIVDLFKGVKPIFVLVALSVIQFGFTPNATTEIKSKNNKIINWKEFFFGTETWSVVLIFFVQELPYLIARAYIIREHGFFVHPTIAFFFLKNIFMVLANIYRIYTFYEHYIEIINGGANIFD